MHGSIEHRFGNHAGKSVQRALRALNDALQAPDRSTAVRRPAADGIMRLSADALRSRLFLASARQMASAPWRIARAVYPWRAPHWPVEDRTHEDVLADCRASIGREIARQGHWTHDMNRLIALRQAEAALLLMRERDERARG